MDQPERVREEYHPLAHAALQIVEYVTYITGQIKSSDLSLTDAAQTQAVMERWATVPDELRHAADDLYMHTSAAQLERQKQIVQNNVNDLQRLINDTRALIARARPQDFSEQTVAVEVNGEPVISPVTCHNAAQLIPKVLDSIDSHMKTIKGAFPSPASGHISSP